MRITQLHILVLLFVLITARAHSQDPFAGRLSEIREKLEELSDSVVQGLDEQAEFSVVNASVQELLRGAAEAHSLNVNVSPEIKVRITNNFTNVTVKDLILFLCKNYSLDIEFVGNILSFKEFQAPQTKVEVPKDQSPKISYDPETDLLSVDLKEDSLFEFTRELTRVTGKNVILAPEVNERKMRSLIQNVQFFPALEKIAYANNLRAEKSEDENFYILHNSGKSDNLDVGIKSSGANKKTVDNKLPDDLFIELVEDSLLNIEALNIPVSEIINQAAYVSGNDYIFFSVPSGSTYLKVKRISFQNLLALLLKGTDHTCLFQKQVYMIGKKQDEGFRDTKLVKFQYRTLWDIEQAIPAPLKENIQVIPFEELNAFILSGGSSRISELERFLKEMDQPIPNILINVMVLEVRKTKSTETGISAAFGDSIQSSGGTVFPGVDVTLSSKSINSLLDKLQQNSIVNLGRVRSNFYMSLKALEQNGNVKIKSTPKLSTLNGHEAQMTIGKSVYYKETTQNVTGGVNTVVTTSPRFSKVDANLTIKIRPLVSGDENITLDITAEFSDFIPAEIEDAPPGNATRKFVSQIRILNQETILLGGMEEVSDEENHSGVPILSRIPVLKWIFSSNSTTKSNSKLLVMIQPEIVY